MSKTKPLRLSLGSRYLVPIGVVATAGVIGASMLWPISTNEAMAANLPVSLTKSLASEIELSIGGEGMGMLTPSEGVADTTVVNRTLSIGLTNSGGYSVQLSAKTTALTGTSNDENVIPGITSVTTLAQMPNNTWGYSIDGTFYKAPSTSTTEAYKADVDISNKQTKTHTLSFAAKVDADTPADTYTNTVYVSVVSEPREVATFAGLTMQQITPAVCKQAAIHETAYLKDERDNNYYWITKLKDGNCWMSQNLDLNLDPAKPLTIANGSASNYTPEVATIDSAAMLQDGKDPYASTYWNNSNAIYSWDEGQYVVIKPEGAHTKNVGTTAAQGGLSGWANSSKLNSIGIPSGGTSSRVTYTVNGVQYDGVVANVASGWTVATDPNFTASSSYSQNGNGYNKTAGWAIDPVNKVYDAHYLVGNYYQWFAATAQKAADGTKVTGDGTNVSSSICPKGWQLPTSGEAHQGNGSFYNMLKNYGNLATAWNDGVTLPNATNATDNIAESPLFFMRSGSVSTDNRILWRFACAADYWSSTAASALSAYMLDAVTIVSASQTRSRSGANPVRCLVLVPEG